MSLFVSSNPLILEIQWNPVEFYIFDIQNEAYLLKSSENAYGLHSIYNSYKPNNSKFGNGNGDAFNKLGFWKNQTTIVNSDGSKTVYKDHCVAYIAKKMTNCINNFLSNIVNTPIYINPWICICALLPNDSNAWKLVKTNEKMAHRYFGMKQDIGITPFDLMNRMPNHTNKNWENVEDFITKFLNGERSVQILTLKYEFLNREWNFKFRLNIVNLCHPLKHYS
jgi:hypothetical protein